jgi:hypothetical protein
MNTTTTTETYRVFKNGRKIPKKVFATYDAARSWVRRKVRSLREKPGIFPFKIGEATIGFVDPSDETHRTPTIGFHGYSIKKVEV